MLSKEVIFMTVFGENAISKVRNIIGATNHNKTKKDNIRFIYWNKEDVTRNITHASNSKENAEIELNRFNKYRKILKRNYNKK